MTRTRTGRCGCGAVTFSVPDDPLIVHCCHCTYCQRESGSSFGLNFLIEADRVVWRGTPEETLTDSISGKGQRIFRCPTCKIALSSHYPGFGPGVHFLRTGTFDEVDGIAPDVHFFTSTKQEWVNLDGGAPVYEDMYKTREIWSAEKWGRLRKAVKG